MFELKSKKEIGDYLRDLIEQKFGTPSEFCRAYIEVSGSQNDETKFSNLKNRISSISNLIHELNKCFDDILALNPEKGEKNVF